MDVSGDCADPLGSDMAGGNKALKDTDWQRPSGCAIDLSTASATVWQKVVIGTRPGRE